VYPAGMTELSVNQSGPNWETNTCPWRRKKENLKKQSLV